MLVKALLFNDGKRKKKKKTLCWPVLNRGKKVVTDLGNGEQMYTDRAKEKHGRYRKCK